MISVVVVVMTTVVRAERVEAKKAEMGLWFAGASEYLIQYRFDKRIIGTPL